MRAHPKLTLIYKHPPPFSPKNKPTDLLEAVDTLLKVVRAKLGSEYPPSNPPPSPKAKPDELVKAIDVLLKIIHLKLDRGDAPPTLPPPSPKARAEEGEKSLPSRCKPGRSDTPLPPPPSPKARSVEASSPDTPLPSLPSKQPPLRLMHGADNVAEPPSPPLIPSPHDASVHELGRGEMPPPIPPPSPKAKAEESSGPDTPPPSPPSESRRLYGENECMLIEIEPPSPPLTPSPHDGGVVVARGQDEMVTGR